LDFQLSCPISCRHDEFELPRGNTKSKISCRHEILDFSRPHVNGYNAVVAINNRENEDHTLGDPTVTQKCFFVLMYVMFAPAFGRVGEFCLRRNFGGW